MHLRNKVKGLKLSEIAKKLNFELVLENPEKDPVITGFAPLSEAKESQLSFSKSKYIGTDIKCGGIFIKKNSLPDRPYFNFILCEDPQKSLIETINLFYTKRESRGVISKTAKISSSAKLADNVEIGENVFIGDNVEIGDNSILFNNSYISENSVIGDNALIHCNVVIRENTLIGDNVKIQSNSTIGSDGFGYLPDKEKGLIAVPQIGKVIIGDFVEIGANTCIDRGAIGDTSIGTGTKIDNQVQIGHNVKVGNFCIICGQAAIAGSSTIGDQCVLGGNVKVGDHVTIVSNVRIGGSGIAFYDIKEPGDYAGIPIQKARDWRKDSS